jgi:hypothetical protein
MTTDDFVPNLVGLYAVLESAITHNKQQDKQRQWRSIVAVIIGGFTELMVLEVLDSIGGMALKDVLTHAVLSSLVADPELSLLDVGLL